MESMNFQQGQRLPAITCNRVQVAFHLPDDREEAGSLPPFQMHSSPLYLVEWRHPKRFPAAVRPSRRHRSQSARRIVAFAGRRITVRAEGWCDVGDGAPRR